ARRPLRLARLASLRLVLEILVGEEELLAGGPDELCTAINAGERLILELHRSLPSRDPARCPRLELGTAVRPVQRPDGLPWLSTTRLRDAASCGYACARVLASHADDPPASDRTNAS